MAILADKSLPDSEMFTSALHTCRQPKMGITPPGRATYGDDESDRGDEEVSVCKQWLADELTDFRMN